MTFSGTADVQNYANFILIAPNGGITIILSFDG